MKLGNDPTLSAREIATIQAWVDAGALQGQSAASVDLNAAAICSFAYRVSSHHGS
jgi:hypothetical protein